MSTNQIPNPSIGLVTNNVTTDGQGHYVVYHEPPASHAPTPTQHFPAPPPSSFTTTPTIRPPATHVASSSVSGVSTARPRILTRPGVTVPPPAFIPSSSMAGMVRHRNPNLQPKSSAPVPVVAGQQMKQPNMQYPRVVTIMDGAANGNFSGMTQPPTALTIYPDSRQSTNEAILTTGTSRVNYTTLTSVENYQMNLNNVYMETLSTNNIDPSSSTVLMASDNQLYNIQNNNGETVIFCPSSVTEEHGSINLMPLIDASDASMGQLHVSR